MPARATGPLVPQVRDRDMTRNQTATGTVFDRADRLVRVRMRLDNLAAMRGNDLFDQLRTTHWVYEPVELTVDHRERRAWMQ
jgi:hypothetical protein